MPQQRTNATNSGRIPANFFLMNPDLIGGRGPDDQHVHVRLPCAADSSSAAGWRTGSSSTQTTRSATRRSLRGRHSGVTSSLIRDAGDPGDITHVFKLSGLYDLPFGQGRRFGGNVNGFVNRFIGDWSVSMVARIQSGRLVDLGQRPARGHDRRRCAGLLQDAVRRRGKEDLDVAAGRDRQHDPGVQRQRDAPDRLRRR